MLLSEKIDFRAKNKEVYFITIKESITPEDIRVYAPSNRPWKDTKKKQGNAKRNKEFHNYS